jgi:orotidine-5'-phosphate decarboxylase
MDAARENDAGIFVLVKTSNPEGGLFQDLVADGEPIYRHVAAYVEQLALDSCGASQYGLAGAVVGATYPEQLTELRSAMPHTWFLVPGFGAQGGSASSVAGAFDTNGLGAIVNNSRGIIFAHAREQYRDKYGDARWQDAVEAATKEMIHQLRDETDADNLGVIAESDFR